ncbi:Membrane anchor Opy2 [Metarhizium album ARSEF 1941]|uniref:Membrane anchor Opy2 n=1 Tax=Metarhizium album (strain ARSEF 1941) TaxID=1081103 RepID=A0A0B2WT52_METAS|nr:Membrane anchor Opy2 [Metarhizium album ARSEF 1941]KHN96677.1 Membrane anchor Opy2 [Metarhizium album ARSEF 1941]
MIGQTPYIIAKDLAEVDEILNRRSLNRRDGYCVQCDDTSKLKCPSCAEGQSCQFTVPVNCSQCPKSICVGDESPGNGAGKGTGDSSKDSSGPSAAPIAGGVVGGIAAIAIITFLIWRFVIKPKRASNPHHSVYETRANPARHIEKDDASRMTRRSSTHTVHSIASTVLTRASNIIQIAYIPGVTNRATPTSPTVLVPPVPPIPIQHSEGSHASSQDEQHFFVPGNLRDSTYSGISSFSDRTSYAPRSSIASTIYGKQAQVQTPAQTGMRAKPTVVSVKSAGTSASGTPPVPAIDFERFGSGRPHSGASNFSVGSTYLNNANTAQHGRAQVVKLGSGLKKIEISSRSDASVSSTSLVSATSSKDSSGAIPILNESPSNDQGPFSDPPERKVNAICTPTLGAVMEEAEERRGVDNINRPSSGDRGRSPFSDEHATRE